jgi:phage terminase large subunit-like protein
MLVKQELDEWLENVDYRELNDSSYVPSEFSLIFMNFIKLVNGVEGESHKTPPVHLKMLDKLANSTSENVLNLCFRGSAKTTLFFEYLVLFIAFYSILPGFGPVSAMIYVSDSMDNGVKSARKNIEFRYENSEFLKEWIPLAKFTDNYIEFTNKEGHRLGIKMFGAKTGIRGTKIFGKRPPLAVLDDLISDEDSKSKTAMQSIKDTVYKGINHALDPTRRKIVFNGTPFTREDIMVEAVESGAWDVNVWPVCETWPCSQEEFVGAWPDRFTYDYVKKQWDDAVLLGETAGFMQELMLRITSSEDRLVQDEEIRKYKRTQLLNQKSAFNFYITTDFATSEKQSADYSPIAVWAYNSNGDWFWVDGVCERQDMGKNIEDLFRLVSEYRPQSVGIEISGQQGAFVIWLQSEMMRRNIWFNFASSDNSNKPGIRPVQNKLVRFSLVVPLFKAGKIYFPFEMEGTKIMNMYYGQIKLATKNGLKGKDDCIDTISQLMYMNPWKPTEDTSSQIGHNGGPAWDEDENDGSTSNTLSSYIV